MFVALMLPDAITLPTDTFPDTFAVAMFDKFLDVSIIIVLPDSKVPKAMFPVVDMRLVAEMLSGEVTFPDDVITVIPFTATFPQISNFCTGESVEIPIFPPSATRNAGVFELSPS